MKCRCCTETRTTRAWTYNSACACAKLSSITLPDFLAFPCLTLCSPSYAASARGHVDIVDMLISAGQLPRHTSAPPKPFRKQHKLNVIFWGKIEALRVAISFLCRQNLFRWALSNCSPPPPPPLPLLRRRCKREEQPMGCYCSSSCSGWQGIWRRQAAHYQVMRGV
jgi:hypothetical protein